MRVLWNFQYFDLEYTNKRRTFITWKYEFLKLYLYRLIFFFFSSKYLRFLLERCFDLCGYYETFIIQFKCEYMNNRKTFITWRYDYE